MRSTSVATMVTPAPVVKPPEPEETVQAKAQTEDHLEDALQDHQLEDPLQGFALQASSVGGASPGDADDAFDKGRDVTQNESNPGELTDPSAMAGRSGGPGGGGDDDSGRDPVQNAENPAGKAGGAARASTEGTGDDGLDQARDVIQNEQNPAEVPGGTVVQAKREGGMDPMADTAGAPMVQLAADSFAGLQFKFLETLQLKGDSGAAVKRTAARGIEGAGTRLPHLDRIQESFGKYDVSGVKAHTGPFAQAAATQMKAKGYASGDHVALKSNDLHTAAHEAAHTVQQQAGVSLKGGVGQAGDVYEKHADAVADAVVQGRSAEPLLDGMAGKGNAGPAVQRKADVQLKPSGGGSEAIAKAVGSAVAQSSQALSSANASPTGDTSSQEGDKKSGAAAAAQKDAKGGGDETSAKAEAQSPGGEAKGKNGASPGDEVSGAVSGLVGEAGGKITSAIDALGQKASGAVAEAGSKVNGAVDGAKGKADEAVDGLSGKATGAIGGAAGKVTGAIDDVGGKLPGPLGKAAGKLGGKVDEAAGELSGKVTGKAEELKGAAGEKAGELTGAVSGKVGEATGAIGAKTGEISAAVGQGVKGIGGQLGAGAGALVDGALGKPKDGAKPQGGPDEPVDTAKAKDGASAKDGVKDGEGKGTDEKGTDEKGTDEKGTDEKGAGKEGDKGGAAKEGGAGAPGAAAQGPASGAKGTAPGGAAVGGAGGAVGMTGGAAPGAPAAAAGGLGSTPGGLQAWMDDPKHQDPQFGSNVDNLGFVTDRVERDQRGLRANLPVPPDHGILGKLLPLNAAFDLKKKLAGNPWKGQDSFLSTMHNINAVVDTISDIAGKISTAATIGGAILTLLVPPVGAFLLTVGRVASAISLVMAGIKALTSTVTAVVTAVRIAKEKDPIKRMEMMREMKTAVMSGVGASVELLLAKLGGGAKGAGGAAAKGMKSGVKGGLKKKAMKELGKQGKSVTGVVGKARVLGMQAKLGIGGALKGGKATLTKHVKGGMANLKGQWGLVKANGFKGNMKRLGASALDKAKDFGTKALGIDKIKKGLSELKKTGQLSAQVKDFKKLLKASGGPDLLKPQSLMSKAKGMAKAPFTKAYWKAVGKTNFPNFGKGQGSKGKVKGLKQDFFDKKAGGYATQLDMGVKGADKSLLDKHKHNDFGPLKGQKAEDRTLAGLVKAKHQGGISKLKGIEKLKGDAAGRDKKIKELGGDSSNAKALLDQKVDKKQIAAMKAELRKQKKYSGLSDAALDPIAKEKAQKKFNYENKQKHGGLVKQANPNMAKSTGELNQALAQKRKKLEKSDDVVHPAQLGFETLVAIGDEESSVGKTIASHFDPTGGKLTGLMGGKTVRENYKPDLDKAMKLGLDTKDAKKDALKGSEGAEKDIIGTLTGMGEHAAMAKSEGAGKQVGLALQAKSFKGPASARVQKLMAEISLIVQARGDSAKAGKGTPKPPSGEQTAAPTTKPGDFAALPPAPVVDFDAPAPAPTEEQAKPAPSGAAQLPPGPEEGELVAPDMSARAAEEQARIDALLAEIAQDKKQSEEDKVKFEEAKKKLQEAQQDLAEKKAGADTQKAHAAKDAAEAGTAQGQLAKATGEMDKQKAVSEGEKGKADAKAKEGSGLTVQADEAKKKAEEDKRAAEEKKNRPWYKKVFDFFAAAAKWVWKKLIAPAIAAVKAALAKVMNYITNMLMGAIIKVVGGIMTLAGDPEAGPRLNETFAAMKQAESKKSEEEAALAGAEVEKTKKKTTSAEQKVDGQIKHTTDNIKKADELKGTLEQNKKALEEAKVKAEASRAAFAAKYTAHFKALEAQEQAGAGGGEQAPAPPTPAPPAPDPAAQVPPASPDAGPAPKPDAGAQQGGSDTEAKNEAAGAAPDAPLGAPVASRVVAAAEVIRKESISSVAEVGSTADGWKKKVEGKADTYKKQAGKEDKEKGEALAKAAGEVHTNVTSAHSATEQDRQKRLDAIVSQAGALATLPLKDGLKLLANLQEQLAREAAEVDESKQAAVDQARQAFLRAARGEG